ncbi:DUF3127 domain-containing protein [Echinicola rosea]|uniref:DUF3127 domain-containing protein n=1 Tax=Echinicola rosea TaxID=1807691 RepID=A0ABQ1VAL4_9BACT|nr:DUF3127 domain-containing protein [Echinicola rosea]GGF48665.1 hypothetical protein GCM10011339_41580 [Echinicola rosea]
MEINGKIIQIMPEQSGNGRNGTWRKQDYILETQGQYPKKVCLTVWGDKIDQFGMQQGDTIKAGIEIESREYNSRWYTDVKVWRVDKEGGAPAGGQAASGSPEVSTFNDESGEDILPF